MIDVFAGIGFIVCAYWAYGEYSKYREKKMEHKRMNAIYTKALALGIEMPFARIINYAHNSGQAAETFHEIVNHFGIKTDLRDVFDKLGTPNWDLIRRIPGWDRDIGISDAIEEMKKAAPKTVRPKE